MNRTVTFALTIGCFLMIQGAWGTPPVEQMNPLDLGVGVPPGLIYPSPLTSVRETPSYDYLAQYSQAAAFIRNFQVDDPGSPDYGGMREAEHMLDVVETDNTSESIWIWTRYFELTGDNQYSENIQRAWTYCLRNPAYSEEGPEPGPFAYYKVYNCAWAMTAESKYRQVYGDETHRAYGDSCAKFVNSYRLDVFTTSFPYNYLNPPVAAWAAGNLYAFGEGVGDSTYMTGAADIGGDVKSYIETDPWGLYLCYWAMSGGSSFWGVINSYLKIHPEQAHDWAATYAAYLPQFAPYGQFQYAWDNWYALGHYAAWGELATKAYKQNHRALSDSTIARDRDLDGGLAANMYEPDNHDQTWITNYKGYMCLDPSIPPVDLVFVADTSSVTRGSRLRSTVGLANSTDLSQTFQFWTELTLPDGSPYPGNPVVGPVTVTLPPRQVVSRPLNQPVPRGAFLGAYVYTAKIGAHPDQVDDEDEFRVTVTGH